VLKRVLVVVLLGFLGLAAGMAFGAVFPRYQVDYAILLPAHSPHSASDLVRMTRDDHPGVRVVDYRLNVVEFSAIGSLASAERAVNLAARDVIAANDGKVKTRFISNPGQIPQPAFYALIGLLAGVGIALGFVVPPKSRLTDVQ